jgi:hypothetical protein
MLITAHGGALNTGRNSPKYFNEIYRHAVDVIEVDVWIKGNLIYISHLPAFFPNRCLTLEYVFEYIAKHNFKVNCDLKQKGTIGKVIALAEKKGVLDRLIFTGAVMPADLPEITAGDVYVNNCFYRPLSPRIENLKEIKKFLDECANPHIKGINISYGYATEEFIEEAVKLGVALSIYTIDNPSELKRIMNHNVANVTTNIVLDALKIKETL